MIAAAVLTGSCGPSKEDTDTSTATDASTGSSPSSETTEIPVPTSEAGETSTTNDATSNDATTGETGDETTDGPGCMSAPAVTLEAHLLELQQDLSGLDLAVQPFTRYVSLAHLHNAGQCAPELALAREAFAKLVNALSDQPNIVAPAAVGGDALLLRIDLRDYGWDVEISGGDMQVFPDTWELIARQNPHAVQHPGELAQAIADATATDLPLLPVDAVIAAAALPPLYYDALRAPTTLAALEMQLEVDLAEQLADEMASDPDDVARATLRVSDVVDFNRVLDRHQLATDSAAALWRTHDFTGDVGMQDPFLHPFEFADDASEVLFSLANGLHGYMIVNPDGDRLDTMPIQIEHDFMFPDTAVRAGLSCMGCHTQGLLKANDDLRFDLDNGQLEQVFDEVTKDQIRNVNPIREAMDQLMDADIQRFTDALALAGVTLGPLEPVTTVFVDFEAPVDLTRAAAELHLPVDELAASLGVLPNALAGLADGTVSRAVFSDSFAESVCALELGKTTACP